MTKWPEKLEEVSIQLFEDGMRAKGYKRALYMLAHSSELAALRRAIEKRGG